MYKRQARFLSGPRRSVSPRPFSKEREESRGDLGGLHRPRVFVQSVIVSAATLFKDASHGVELKASKRCGFGSIPPSPFHLWTQAHAALCAKVHLDLQLPVALCGFRSCSNSLPPPADFHPAHLSAFLHHREPMPALLCTARD